MFRLRLVDFGFDDIFPPPFGGPVAVAVKARPVVDHCRPQLDLEHFPGRGVVQDGFSPGLPGCLF